MTALEALQAARAVGVDVVLHGNDLALEASSPPPEAVLEALSQNKAEIVALLRPGDDGWNAEDWQVYFDERAGIAEFDGDLSRSLAEAQAFTCCVTPSHASDANAFSSAAGRSRSRQLSTTSQRTRATPICSLTSTTCKASAGPATAARSSQKLAKKLVCWVHEIHVEHYRPGGDLIHMAALTIFDSRACKQAWIDALGPLPNAAVIHPFVNRDILDAVAQEHLPFSRDPNSRSANADGPAPRAAIRAALGVNEDDFLVLSLASVEPRKGQKLLQQTVARLAAETGLPVKLLLVGFRNWRRRMKWFLRMNAREWAVLPPRRAYVWQMEIAAFYRAADAFVTNSQGRGALRGECFGRVTVEAMAAGAVALGTDAGGTSEIIVDGESGFLYPTGKEGQQELAMRLKGLIEDPALARRVAESGRRRALSSFSEERFFGEFSERLSGLLKA